MALGAFAAHALKDRFDDYSLKVFHTGVDYQFFHSFALAVVGILFLFTDHVLLRWAGSAFALGIFIFSGSLYLLAFTQIRVWGAVTPFGGISFLIGWGILFYFCLAVWNIK